LPADLAKAVTWSIISGRQQRRVGNIWHDRCHHVMANNEGNYEMSERTRKITLPVTGMTCASCAAAIEQGLAKLPGLSRVNVNVASEAVSIEYDPRQLDVKALIDAISDAGYGVALEKATFRVGGMTCASCVANVEMALNKLPGVISASVNLASEKATVTYLRGEADMAEFRRAVESAGLFGAG
jgi:P-type Cu+ transporter